MELSIIIITLNEEKLLPNLLLSIKKQKFKDYEIIVSDAKSYDRTRKIAMSFDCKIVDGGNYTIGRNNGAKISKGKYLLFLDADCELPEDFLEINLNAFKNSGCGVGTTEVKPMSNLIVDKIFFMLYNYWSAAICKISPHCCGASIFSTKSKFDEIGGFDERVIFGENHDFVRRGCRDGFVILPKYIYTSVRRLDRDGRIKFFFKYIYAGLYRLFYKEIDKKLFEYDNKR